MRVAVVILAGVAGCGRSNFELLSDTRVDDPLDVGLVGHWPFEEGSGTFTADTSGFENHGTLVGSGVAFVDGRIGMALSFDGVDGRVDITETTNVLDVGMASFSVSVWINVGAPAGLYDCPWWRGGSSTSYAGYDIELGTAPWHVGLSDGVDVALGTLPEVVGRWVLLTAVVDRDADTLTLYEDSAMVDADAITLGTLAQTRTAKIGDTVGGMGVIRGLVDDIRVYDRALTAAEVDALSRAP